MEHNNFPQLFETKIKALFSAFPPLLPSSESAREAVNRKEEEPVVKKEKKVPLFYTDPIFKPRERDFVLY